ncbi:MAG: hypothetical protein COA67_04905 [Lutibacter sp.]|nr:MAG: hypothetical protein COA67_04905 [Lutibacter sp.]
MRFLKKLFRVTSYILIGLLIVFLVLLQFIFKVSTDVDVKEELVNITLTHHQFNNHEYRKIVTFQKLDTTIPTLVFVHGSPGSMLDFKNYFKDTVLTKKANLIAYERVGYGIDNIGDIQTIKNEVEMLNSITDSLPISKTILVGYSYGGSIALASKKKYRKIVLLAPAVYSEVEPMFWFLNIYKWRSTRWLMPKILQGAAKEKIQHQDELRKFQENWNENSSDIYVVHGDKDWIVPLANSEYIQQQFNSTQFELVTLKGAGHGLVWEQFEEVKSELIKVIEE